LNYIAHIHIAHHTQTSLLGNFLGDFVKGQALNDLPAELATGVRLHRKVDLFTDNHELVVNLRRTFPKELRRVAGIIIDITFDHFLLQQWDELTTTSTDQVLDTFYQQLADFNGIDSVHFSRLSESLLKDRWLIEYHQQQTCLRALHSIERRLKHKIIFAKQAFVFFQLNQASFAATFRAFYPELLIYALHCSQKLSST
jgi:acyl carrier protein phosphodiesterase